MHSCKIVPQESCRSAQHVTRGVAALACDFLSIPPSIYRLDCGVKHVFTSNFSTAEEYLFL